MNKYTKVLLTSLSLITTTIVLPGCSNGSPSPVIEEDRVDLSFLLDDTFTITNETGFTLDENGYASLIKGTDISFKIQVNENTYLASSGLVVTANDQALIPANDVYSLTVNEDVFIVVDGFVDAPNKYRITVDTPYGVSFDNDSYPSYPDGSYLLYEGQYEFILSYLEGVSHDEVKVYVDDIELLPNNGKYVIQLEKDINVRITGTSYQQARIQMNDTALYSFTNIKGVTIKDGEGFIDYGSEISFEVYKTILAKVSSGGIVVKNNDVTLTSKDGVYSFKADKDSSITVSGLEVVTSSSEVTGQSFEKEVLNDCAFTSIVSSNGALVSGSANDQAPKENGYQKATYVAGEYGVNQIALFGNEQFVKYESIEFMVNPITGDYLEFFAKDSKTALFNIHTIGWYSILLLKDGGDVHIYVNGVDKGVIASTGDMLSSIQMKIQGTYLFTELVALKDASYKDVHYYTNTPALSEGVYQEGLDEETEFGLKKWYLISDSSYGIKKAYSNINPEAYNEIMYDIKPIGDFDGGPWFGFNAPGSTGGFAKDTVTSAIFTKNELGKWTLTIKGSKETTTDNLDLGDDLSEFVMCLHPNKGKLNYLVSNLRLVNDPEYDPLGQKQVTITHDTLSHITYKVTGQSSDTFKVDNNTDVIITITPNDGYVGVVTANGDVVKGDNNVYTIRITKTTTIHIAEEVYHQIDMLTEAVCTGSQPGIDSDYFKSYDPTITKAYKGAKTSSGTLYPTSDVDLTGYVHLYFYVYNHANTQAQFYPENNESNCCSVGGRGEVVLVTLDLVDNVWKVQFNGKDIDKLSKKSQTNFSGLMYLQFWGTSYLSALYGYKA